MSARAGLENYRILPLPCNTLRIVSTIDYHYEYDGVAKKKSSERWGVIKANKNLTKSSRAVVLASSTILHTFYPNCSNQPSSPASLGSPRLQLERSLPSSRALFSQLESAPDCPGPRTTVLWRAESPANTLTSLLRGECVLALVS
ncbi:hypothetical protein RRG08_005723 [Elysia crispata]|uniref:Uncharacterized protein n=1 Tax=Elysia crispata TaxID=231223 RepID=A0AAE1CX10_9GAST|nr:hypothetical protein RRG08_005723 [Elysia crispata]